MRVTETGDQRLPHRLRSASRLLWTIAVITIPAAAVIVVLLVRYESDRAFIAFVLAVAWIGLLLSRSQARWQVTLAVVIEAVLTVAWTATVWIAATPCALSGKGILTPTVQCPLQATHVVSAVLGGAGCLTLVVTIGAGIQYVRAGDERAHRRFKVGLGLAAVLVLLWLGFDVLLPRTAPSD